MIPDSQIDSTRQRLDALILHLNDSLSLCQSASQPVALDQTLQGRVSRGDALQQQEMAKANQTLNQKHLVKAKAALARLNDGDYGECLECREDIAPGRLEIMPEAELCINCKEAQEIT